MKEPLATNNSPRQSTDSRNRPSFSLARKTSGTSVSNKSGEKRRFSLLPASFSLKNFGSSSNKEHSFDRAPQRGATAAGHPSDSVESMPYTSSQPLPPRSAPQEQQVPTYPGERGYNNSYPAEPLQINRTRASSNNYGNQENPRVYGSSAPADGYLAPGSRMGQSATVPDLSAHGQMRYPPGFNEYDDPQGGRASAQSSGRQNRVLQKPNRKFADGYDDGNHAGSSSAAKRVMDFFRRRSKARGAEGQ